MKLYSSVYDVMVCIRLEIWKSHVLHEECDCDYDA